MPYCQRCGANVQPEMLKCDKCGTPLEQPQPVMQTSNAPARGGCLTVYLVLMTISMVWMIPSSLMGAYARDSMKDLETIMPLPPAWMYFLSAFFGVIGLISVIGLWTWKKWGAYGMVAMGVISTAVSLAVMSGNLLYVATSSGGFVIGMAIMFIAIKPYWNQMS
jgi:hypothetical protein